MTHRDIIEKLRDADAHLDRLQDAADMSTVRREFNACLAALKAAQYKLESAPGVLRKTGRRSDIEGFRNWWKSKQAVFQADPLLKWVSNVRDSDTHHRERSPLLWEVHQDVLHSEDMLPGPPGASKWAIGPDGAEWILDEGTGRERRVPVRLKPGSPSANSRDVVFIGLREPPTSHLGEPLTDVNLFTLCRLAIDYWRKVADEAFELWWPDLV